jgi:hypothetical protein
MRGHRAAWAAMAQRCASELGPGDPEDVARELVASGVVTARQPERARQMQAVCDAAVAWVGGASGAEQALRSAVARWWEAEGKRLDAAMAKERAAAAREPEAPAPAPRVGQRWRRKATGEAWRVWHVGPERVGLALASGVGERGTSVALSELLAGDAWELVATPEPEGPGLDQRIGGLIVGVKPPEPEAPPPADECGAVDGVFGPGLGPVCTRPKGHDGNHMATCPATGREVSAWDDMPGDERDMTPICNGSGGIDYSDGSDRACPGCAACGPDEEPPEQEPPADGRWQPGAVWEHSVSTARRLEVLHADLHGMAQLRVQGSWSAMQSVPMADMTPENGWRYVGRAAEASPGPAPRRLANQIELERKVAASGQQGAQHDIPAAVRALIQDWAGRWADVARLARDRRDARGAVEDESRHDALTELVAVYEQTTANGIPAGALDRFKLGPEYGEAQVRVFAEAGTALLAALNGPAAPEVQPPTASEVVTAWACRREDCDRVGLRVYRTPAEASALENCCAWCGAQLEREGEARVLRVGGG